MIAEMIAQHILDVHFGNNWTEVTIRETLDDVTLEEALTVTAASPNHIAGLTYHLSFYNKHVLQRLAGSAPEIPESNGFDLPPINDEAGWEQLKADLLESAELLADAVKPLPDDVLNEPILEGYSSRYKTLHGIAEHAHYHLGQMVILKKLIRNLKAEA
ncbi:DinB family protein [Foetidibacter luteolus]|uniref:DinB family protein n=1 Tax=Foetidibacter luteolus TaxID=2608880 RepID=UPI00129AD1B2|nr:DinB family protein [Foetidibacter luteolus]